MSLSKKHFKKIAEILNNYYIDEIVGKKVKIALILKDLSNYFKAENPNFDEQKFKKAVLK